MRHTTSPASKQVAVSPAYRLAGVEVYSMDGQQLYHADTQGLTSSFSVRGWPYGSYIVLVHTAGGTTTKHLLVRP